MYLFIKARLYDLHRNCNRETTIFSSDYDPSSSPCFAKCIDMLHKRPCLISDCPGRTLTGVSDLTSGHVNPCVDVDVEDDVRIPPSCFKKKMLFIFS